MVEKGIKRRGVVRASGCVSDRQRLPIIPSILRKIKTLWAPKATEYESILIRAVCCTAFFGFFKLGEILEPTSQSEVGVRVSDALVDSVDNPMVVAIFLKKSKTDQFSKGATVYPGATERDICPVLALLSYLAARGSTGGPLFRWNKEKALTKQEFVERIWTALTSLGLDNKCYAGG